VIDFARIATAKEGSLSARSKAAGRSIRVRNNRYAVDCTLVVRTVLSQQLCQLTTSLVIFVMRSQSSFAT
jgi:hypothetical protein